MHVETIRHVTFCAAGSVASAVNAACTAVLEPAGTSIVIFQHADWQQPVGAFSIQQIPDAAFSDTFRPKLSWAPDGAYLALVTQAGHLVAVNGAFQH